MRPAVEGDTFHAVVSPQGARFRVPYASDVREGRSSVKTGATIVIGMLSRPPGGGQA